MAMKDWKKLGKNAWINEKEDVISIDKDMKGNYQIIIVKQSGGLSRESRTGIKTKSQALKYARAYMRKH